MNEVTQADRFADWSTDTMIGQCRAQALENLDPEYTQFMIAVADRLAALSTQPAAAEDEVERVREAISHVPLNFYDDEPLGMNATRGDVIRIARAAIAAMRPEQQWQPIETAPKDGTRLLLYCSDYTTKGIEGRCSVGWYSQWPKMWVHGHSLGPTHWMPTPAPPVAACAKQGGE